jgi:hypothetical protein
MNVKNKKLYSKKRILDMARENNGVVTSAVLTKEGISRGHLRPLVDSGKLSQTARGVYTLPWVFDDDYFNLQTRYRKGIFSGATALFLFDLTDRTPEKPEMTFPLNYNISALLAQPVVCRRAKPDWYESGITKINTPSGNSVRVYGVERTMCELLRRRAKVDIQIVTDAFKRYAKLKNRDIHVLSEYAKVFRVEEKVRSYLEVLI